MMLSSARISALKHLGNSFIPNALWHALTEAERDKIRQLIEKQGGVTPEVLAMARQYAEKRVKTEDAHTENKRKAKAAIKRASKAKTTRRRKMSAMSRSSRLARRTDEAP